MKPWWKSKTLWVNLVALVAVAVQSATGYAVSPELQGGVLALANLGLRLVTSEAVGDPSKVTGPSK